MDVPADVQAILEADERVVYRCGDASPARVGSNLSGVNLLTLGGALFVFLTFGDYIPYVPLDNPLFAGSVVVVAAVGVVGWRAVSAVRRTHTYYVTDSKVISRVESPSETSVSYVDFDTVQTIELTRNRFEQHVDAATIAISTERGYDDAELRYIESGAEAELIEHVRERADI